MVKRNGFNIVELIVVVSIIAGLIAIFVPVLGSVRQIADKVFCKNNLKQLGICVQSYAMENKVYPVCVGDSNLSWNEFIANQDKAKNQMLGVPISLWPYHKEKKIYDCPTLFKQKCKLAIVMTAGRAENCRKVKSPMQRLKHQFQTSPRPIAQRKKYIFSLRPMRLKSRKNLSSCTICHS